MLQKLYGMKQPFLLLIMLLWIMQNLMNNCVKATYNWPANAIIFATPSVTIVPNVSCAWFQNCIGSSVKGGLRAKWNMAKLILYLLGRHTFLWLWDDFHLHLYTVLSNYIPASLSDGAQCCSSQMTILLHPNVMMRHSKGWSCRALVTIPPGPTKHIRILNEAKYISSAISLVGVPK